MPIPTKSGIILGMRKPENGVVSGKEHIYYVGGDIHSLCILSYIIIYGGF